LKIEVIFIAKWHVTENLAGFLMVLAVIGAVCPIGAGSRMVVKGGSFSYHQGSSFCLQGSGLEMPLLIKGRHNGVVKTTNDSNIYKKKCLLLNLFVKNNDWYLKFQNYFHAI
jgi:hypothetical protein